MRVWVVAGLDTFVFLVILFVRSMALKILYYISTLMNILEPFSQ